MGKVCSKLTGREIGELEAQVAGVIAQEAEKLIGVQNEGLGQTAEPAQHVRQVPLTGRRRSLLVGCNYRDTASELHGCVNDVLRLLPILESLGFARDATNQRVLLDETGAAPQLRPTRANMLEAFRWLVEGAKPGDVLLFHYSGHGGREPASDAKDGHHETLVPLDYETAGMLKDTELFEALVRPLPGGCRLTCILDSCHSAGAMDLPYIFVGGEEELTKALSGQAIKLAMTKSWKRDLERLQEGSGKELLSDVGSLGKDLWRAYRQASTGFLEDAEENVGSAVGEVVAITGCRSDQTSADVGDVSTFGLVPVGGDSRGEIRIDPRWVSGGGGAEARAGGALTSALAEALQDPAAAEMTYTELLEKIRQELASKGFSQVPQFLSSLLVDLKQPFRFDTAWEEAPPAAPAGIAGADNAVGRREVEDGAETSPRTSGDQMREKMEYRRTELEA
jgi:hypothetical protein